jgi:hypothetical protein
MAHNKMYYHFIYKFFDAIIQTEYTPNMHVIDKSFIDFSYLDYDKI